MIDGCEREGCNKPIPPGQVAVYCSNECAFEDARSGLWLARHQERAQHSWHAATLALGAEPGHPRRSNCFMVGQELPTAFELVTVALAITQLKENAELIKIGYTPAAVIRNFPQALELLRQAENFIANYEDDAKPT